MGDLLLKQKPRSPQWQPMEMLRRPWPPMYRTPFQRSPSNSHHHHFNFRPPIEPPNHHQYQEPRIYAQNGTSFPNNNIYQTNNSRDYYFLAPFYRNVMPPPPPKIKNERFVLNMDNKKRSTKKIEQPVCHCRSRSMEDVRFDVIDVSPDENGNNIDRERKLQKVKGVFGQHSMENLLADTMYTSSPRRIGSYQV